MSIEAELIQRYNYTENFYNNKKMKHQKMKMFQNSKIVSSIQSHIFSEQYKEKITKYKISSKKIDISTEVTNTLNEIFIKLHYFSYGKDVFDISFKNFKKIQNRKNGLFKLFYKIISKFLDIFTRSKKYSYHSIYHNHKANNKYLITNNIDFNTIYKNVLQDVCKLLTLISEEIYYKKKNSKIIEKMIKNNE